MRGKDRKKAIICSLALIACNLSVTAAEFSSLGVKVDYNSFFTRNGTGKGDIYWVDAKIIEELRPKE